MADRPAQRRRPSSAAPPVDPPDRLPAIADALRVAARRFRTPVYLIDEAAVAAAAEELRAAFPDPWIRQYSLKANDVGFAWRAPRIRSIE